MAVTLRGGSPINFKLMIVSHRNRKFYELRLFQRSAIRPGRLWKPFFTTER
ncbi:hypothetical protein KM472_gp052 [Cynomolgus macaque cytomegalovirus strain Ottawa]|uniref:Uncharacterized protein n=2 Tax=Cytomegalovirus TaxID=10358 RepID=G8H155_9BETA|nr:hypothetical protein KM472_gp052 [Cynomolgus macaque cytomegalovirus strain Ottawa]AEQ32129.1 hypothetical protein cy52_ex1 [Cynomolgus macaque cytomegalovirus strain Ottawa]AKT72914.1 hypothetical protein [Cynomolgus macaque cytomegalovirus strain Mauritius]AXG21746.1 hypothetical protein [synthetic construct]AXG22014.1 hypothetical protein [synthetic construct]